MVEVVPHTVVRLGESEYCMMVLKERDGTRYLPIWMTLRRAEPIVLCMQEIRPSRPRTHDLFMEVARRLGGRLVGVSMYGVEKGIALSRVALSKEGKQIALECSAGDAIALALKEGVPISASDEIMRKAAVALRHGEIGMSAAQSEEDEEKLAVFRDFIDSLDLTGL